MQKMHVALTAAALLAAAPAHAASFIEFTHGPDDDPPQCLLTSDFEGATEDAPARAVRRRSKWCRPTD